jgi:hypothetical protein
VKVIIYIKMLSIFSTLVIIRLLRQLKTVVFLHWSIIHGVLSMTEILVVEVCPLPAHLSLSPPFYLFLKALTQGTLKGKAQYN